MKTPEQAKASRARHLAKMMRERPLEQRAREKRRNDKTYLRRRISRFGITPVEWFRMLDRQEMRCLVCPNRLVISRSPRASRRLTAHVDHDHKTGRVRGILCGECNRGLGQFQDDPQILRSAAAYLEARA